jgi:hypothetical protein
MKKTFKILLGLVFIEAALTAFYLYAQPQCEPCLPGMPCPPCISETQTIAFWTSVLIAMITFGYLAFINFRQLKNGL